MNALDLAVFFALHGLAGQSVIMDTVIVFLGKYLTYLIFAIFAWYVLRAHRAGHVKEVLYGYCVALAGAGIARIFVAESIRLFYHHPRPFIALGVPHLLTETSYSFPSGHTIFLFALATGVYFVNRRFGYFLYAAGLVVGLARVAAGVHYPSDIIGGIILGIATGYVVATIWRAIYKV
jgi:undecaprenyl-diphosphatase